MIRTTPPAIAPGLTAETVTTADGKRLRITLQAVGETHMFALDEDQVIRLLRECKDALYDMGLAHGRELARKKQAIDARRARGFW